MSSSGFHLSQRALTSSQYYFVPDEPSLADPIIYVFRQEELDIYIHKMRSLSPQNGVAFFHIFHNENAVQRRTIDKKLTDGEVPNLSPFYPSLDDIQFIVTTWEPKVNQPKGNGKREVFILDFRCACVKNGGWEGIKCLIERTSLLICYDSRFQCALLDLFDKENVKALRDLNLLDLAALHCSYSALTKDRYADFMSLVELVQQHDPIPENALPSRRKWNRFLNGIPNLPSCLSKEQRISCSLVTYLLPRAFDLMRPHYTKQKKLFMTRSSALSAQCIPLVRHRSKHTNAKREIEEKDKSIIQQILTRPPTHSMSRLKTSLMKKIASTPVPTNSKHNFPPLSSMKDKADEPKPLIWAEKTSVRDKSPVRKPPPPVEVETHSSNKKNIAASGRNTQDIFFDLFPKQWPVHMFVNCSMVMHLDATYPIVFDLRSVGSEKVVKVRKMEHIVTYQDLALIVQRLAHMHGCTDASNLFQQSNSVGIEGTLHRIMCHCNKKQDITGLTIRYDPGFQHSLPLVQQIVDKKKNILLFGAAEKGKTTLLRQIAKYCSENAEDTVVVVDTWNRIGGECDSRVNSLGFSRRLQVPSPEKQPQSISEALEMSASVIVVDEVRTREDVCSLLEALKRGNVRVVASMNCCDLSALMDIEPFRAIWESLKNDPLQRVAQFDEAIHVRSFKEVATITLRDILQMGVVNMHVRSQNKNGITEKKEQMLLC